MAELQQRHEVEGVWLRGFGGQHLIGEPLRGLVVTGEELCAPHQYLCRQELSGARRNVRERLQREVGVSDIQLRLRQRQGDLGVGRCILLGPGEHRHGAPGLMYRRHHPSDAQEVERLALILCRARQRVDHIGRAAGRHEKLGQRKPRLGVGTIGEDGLLKARGGIALALRHAAATDEGERGGELDGRG